MIKKNNTTTSTKMVGATSVVSLDDDYHRDRQYEEDYSEGSKVLDWDHDHQQIQRYRSIRSIRFMEKDCEVASIIGGLDGVSLCETDHDSCIIMPESDDEKDFRRRCCSRRRICYLLAALFLLVIVLFSTLMIGAAVEERNIGRVPSTIAFYTEDTAVCAGRVDGDEEEIPLFKSFSSATEANETIVHCGSCGLCSNAHDMEIYAATRETLTNDATACAYRMFLGQSKVEACLEKKVGFTNDCNDCWVSNVACTFSHCKFTCLKTKLFGSKHNDRDDDLNDCLQCDEVMCGPEFLQCSGANRRRMGIVSDIGRDANQEQCQDVTINWSAAVPAE